MVLASRQQSFSTIPPAENDNAASTMPLSLVARRVCIVKENISVASATIEGSYTHAGPYAKQAVINYKLTCTDDINDLLGHSHCLLFITTMEQDEQTDQLSRFKLSSSFLRGSETVAIAVHAIGVGPAANTARLRPVDLASYSTASAR